MISISANENQPAKLAALTGQTADSFREFVAGFAALKQQLL